MVLKEQGLLEKEFAKDGIAIRWVQTLGSNKALEFLNAGSIDFGSTAGSAALVSKINGNPIKSIYVYSRPEWTALVTRKDSAITKVADLKGKRVAVTRGTDPHIFLVRALLDAGLTEKDITPVLLQHPDGKTALIRGDVDAWAGLDPMMAQAEVEDGAKLFFRKAEANTWGILNVREEFLKDHPDLVRRVLAVYEAARKHSLANYADVKRVFIAATKLPEAVVDKQLKERTELTHQPHRRAAEGVDPRRRPRAAAGRRDQGRRRREGDGREPDRRPLGRGDELTAFARTLSPHARTPAPCRGEGIGARGAATAHRHCNLQRPHVSFLHEPRRTCSPQPTSRIRLRASSSPRSASRCRWVWPSLWELAVWLGLLGRPPGAAALAHLGDAGRARRRRRTAAPCRRDR